MFRSSHKFISDVIPPDNIRLPSFNMGLGSDLESLIEKNRFWSLFLWWWFSLRFFLNLALPLSFVAFRRAVNSLSRVCSSCKKSPKTSEISAKLLEHLLGLVKGFLYMAGNRQVTIEAQRVCSFVAVGYQKPHGAVFCDAELYSVDSPKKLPGFQALIIMRKLISSVKEFGRESYRWSLEV